MTQADKQRQSIRFTHRWALADDGLTSYLQHIGWWNDTQTFSSGQLRAILIEQLRNYLRGSRSADFVLGLASVVYAESLTLDDPDLVEVTCALDDLCYSSQNGQAADHSPATLDHVLQDALRKLTRHETP